MAYVVRFHVAKAFFPVSIGASIVELYAPLMQAMEKITLRR